MYLRGPVDGGRVEAGRGDHFGLLRGLPRSQRGEGGGGGATVTVTPTLVRGDHLRLSKALQGGVEAGKVVPDHKGHGLEVVCIPLELVPDDGWVRHSRVDALVGQVRW